MVGESVVKVAGAGASIGTKPSLPFPDCEAPCLRWDFMGDGFGGPAESESKARFCDEEFSTGCSGSGEGSRHGGGGLEADLERGEDGSGIGGACGAERVELIVWLGQLGICSQQG